MNGVPDDKSFEQFPYHTKESFETTQIRSYSDRAMSSAG